MFLSTVLQQSLAEVTEVVLGCDAAQQANLSDPLMQAMLWWDSRLKVTSIFSSLGGLLTRGLFAVASGNTRNCK